MLFSLFSAFVISNAIFFERCSSFAPLPAIQAILRSAGNSGVIRSAGTSAARPVSQMTQSGTSIGSTSLRSVGSTAAREVGKTVVKVVITGGGIAGGTVLGMKVADWLKAPEAEVLGG